MVRATGTLAGLNEFLSDTPTDIETIKLHVTMIASAISAIASDLEEKLNQTQDLVLAKSLEEEAVTHVNAFNRELERLLEIKNQLANQKR